MVEQFQNNYVTLLNGAIDDNDTTIIVDDAPDMTGSFRIRIEDEIIYVGTATGTTFTGCLRGQEDTVAISHGDNTIVRHVLTAGALENALGTIDTLDSSTISLTSGDIAITSTTFVDVTGASITLTTGANRCLVTVSSVSWFNGLSDIGYLDLEIDGTRVGGTSGLTDSGPEYSSGRHNMGFSYITSSLSAGSHTFKIKARVASTDQMNLVASSVSPLTMGVHELPNSHRLVNADTYDPVSATYGTPTTAFEFDSSSLTGLTALGTPTLENADTTYPGHYYIRAEYNSSPFYRGRGLTVATPFTVITKATGTPDQNYESYGLLVAPSTYPGTGGHRTIDYGFGSSPNTMSVQNWSSASAYSSTVGSVSVTIPSAPFYFAIRAASATDISFYWSPDGLLWRALVTGHNPSFTPTQVFMVAKAENSTGFSIVFDYFRHWNSALTFLT